MARQVQVDTGLMQATAQRGMGIAADIIGTAQALSASIDFVLSSWKGGAGDAFRMAMQQQKEQLNNLVQRLQAVSETMQQGGHGFEGHDASARAKVTTQALSFQLNNPKPA